jgi:PIN domain nuclease of toxin-antitoxin system
MQGGLRASGGGLGDVPQDGDRRAAVALPDLLRERGLGFRPMTWEVAEPAETPPPIHRDPVYRTIVAHALRQGMPVLPDDGAIPAYGVATIR